MKNKMDYVPIITIKDNNQHDIITDEKMNHYY